MQLKNPRDPKSITLHDEDHTMPTSHYSSASSLSVFCSRLKSHFFSLLLIIYVPCPQSDTVILDTLIVRTYLLTTALAHTASRLRMTHPYPCYTGPHADAIAA